jgi:2-amino-4-hydroxy-6-hydroxymethyldihydropteridine diphosphokinase
VKSNSAFIGLGSNIGDRADNLERALRAISDAGIAIVRESSIYETEPVGVPDEQPWYLNMIAEVGGALPSPLQLLRTLLDIESTLGRTRNKPLAARVIDLDLLIYGLERIEESTIIVPHPRLHLRRFVLLPLCELAPNGRHPSLDATFQDLLESCPDKSRIRLWKSADKPNVTV